MVCSLCQTQKVSIPSAVSHWSKTFTNLIWKKIWSLSYKYFIINKSCIPKLIQESIPPIHLCKALRKTSVNSVHSVIRPQKNSFTSSGHVLIWGLFGITSPLSSVDSLKKTLLSSIKMYCLVSFQSLLLNYINIIKKKLS